MATIIRTKLSGSSPSFGWPGGNVLKCGIRSKTTSFRIGTWNVKTMAQPGKIENTIQEMKRMNTEIMGISEMRWPGEGCEDIDDYCVWYSGRADGKHEHGVGMIVKKGIANCVTHFRPISERIMMLQLNATPTKLNIIQVYYPTTDYDDREVERVYEEIKRLMETIPKEEVLIIMGDFNARVGKGVVGELIGQCGLGERNERGEIMTDFVQENDLVVTNTFFQLPPRRLYTWKSPDQKNTKSNRLHCYQQKV